MKRVWKELAVVAVCAAGILCAAHLKSNRLSGEVQEANIALSEHRDHLAKITISQVTWRKGAGGVAMVGALEVHNSNRFDIKRFVVTCSSSVSDGTRVDFRTRHVYEIVPAGATRTIRDIDMALIHTKSTNESCAVSDFRAI